MSDPPLPYRIEEQKSLLIECKKKHEEPVGIFIKITIYFIMKPQFPLGDK